MKNHDFHDFRSLRLRQPSGVAPAPLSAWPHPPSAHAADPSGAALEPGECARMAASIPNVKVEKNQNLSFLIRESLVNLVKSLQTKNEGNRSNIGMNRSISLSNPGLDSLMRERARFLIWCVKSN